MIIKTPNNAGRITSRVASNTTLNRSFNGKTLIEPPLFLPITPLLLASLNRRIQFSTIIIAPSTINPKSRAPKLIRLALTLVCTMPVMVINIAIGITIAVSNAARILPKNINKITITNSAPSIKFFCTVCNALSTKLVRS